MRRGVIAAAVASLSLVLAGCGSSTPNAMALAAKIPACSHAHVTASSGGPAAQDASCVLFDGNVVEVATFDTAADERAWVANESAQPGECCAVGPEGDNWAAVDSDISQTGLDLSYVADALHGTVESSTGG